VEGHSVSLPQHFGRVDKVILIVFIRDSFEASHGFATWALEGVAVEIVDAAVGVLPAGKHIDCIEDSLVLVVYAVVNQLQSTVLVLPLEAGEVRIRGAESSLPVHVNRTTTVLRFS